MAFTAAAAKGCTKIKACSRKVAEQTAKVVSKLGARNINNVDDLLKAGQKMDRNGLTKAGRALQKHGDRTGSKFPQVKGSAKNKNEQGQSFLKEILTSKNQSIKNNKFGGRDIVDKNTGRGVRFDKDNNMMGFLN